MEYIKQPIVIEDTAPPEHVGAVVDAFSRAGVEVEVEAIYGRRAFDPLPWVIVIELLGPVRAFVSGFFGAAGGDAYSGLKALLKDLVAARSGAGNGKGAIELRDPEHTAVIFSDALPDEAFEALRHLDWEEKRGDYLVWDARRNEWWDPTKREPPA